MEGKRMAETPKSVNRGSVIFLGVVGVLLCAYLGLCAWAGGQNIFPNVYLAGVDVSGMTREQAAEVAADQLEKFSGNVKLKLKYGEDREWRMDAEHLVPDEDFALRTADAAMAVGRDNFFVQGFHYLRLAMNGLSVVPLDVDYAAVEQPMLEALFDHVEVAVSRNNRSSYRYDEKELTMTKGVTDLSLDRQATAAEVYETLLQAYYPVQYEAQPTGEGEAHIQVVVTQTPPQEPEFDGIWRELYAEVAEPTYDKETGAVSDHVVGVDFDVEELKAAYQAAGEGETFSIPLTVTQPKDTKQSYEQKLFADVLGSGRSQVTGSANRKSNVKLSAAACDGVILLPGEVFSYNTTTGSRTADKGYLPAPTYNAGASVDDVGGGICQTSSTIYYALLHTPLTIVERQNHSYATGYVPDGMDATVFFGSLDFRFENSTNYPLKIVTESYDQNGKRYLKVDLLGTNEDGRYAKPTNYVFDVVQPTNTYVADESVPQGTLVLDKKQNSYRGRKAKVTRTIYAADGTVVEEQDLGTSRYKMRPNVYHYNPLDGDPATWPDGQPPKPQPVAPVAPVTPEPPAPKPVPDTPYVPVVPDVPTSPDTPVEPIPPTGADSRPAGGAVVENTQPPVSP